jgi:DNA-binding transcriptional ArsR family regulator
MPYQQPNLDRVFRALGDATRMAVIVRLSRGDASASELAKPFDMALPSFTQHLGMLEDSGLVSSEKIGRTRIYKLKKQKLNAATHWLEAQRSLWTKRLDQLDAFLIATKDKKP